MSQQQLQQPTQGTGQQHQHGTGQGTQPTGQTFDQYVPQQVSQAVYQLEQLESDAEWAHGQAMKIGDTFTANKLADIAGIVHLQKELLLRESGMAATVGQCTEQALQQCGQTIQGSQVPGVQGVVQQAQQVAGTISQASSQVGQSGATTQTTGGQSGPGGQSMQGGGQLKQF